ncbi:MAG TPA: hypothetical protein ENJ09_03015 [Planctomycetes bacterium]|nr:hypothetical protein [Planctomycetota bacterium]
MKRPAFPALALSLLVLLSGTSAAQADRGRSKAHDARGGREVQEERDTGGSRDRARRADEDRPVVRDAARGAERQTDRARDGVRDGAREEVRDKARDRRRAEGQDVDRPRDKGRPAVDGARGQERALVEELVQHRERLAKLERLSEIFGAKPKDKASEEKLGRVRRLREKEMARHRAAMERFRKNLGADAVEAIQARNTVTRDRRATDHPAVRDGEGPRDGKRAQDERVRDGKRSEGHPDRDS